MKTQHNYLGIILSSLDCSELLGSLCDFSWPLHWFPHGRLWSFLNTNQIISTSSQKLPLRVKSKSTTTHEAPSDLALVYLSEGSLLSALPHSTLESSTAPSLFSFLIYSFIHMCIHCLGHFSPLQAPSLLLLGRPHTLFPLPRTPFP
jgi:hypothetical protein